MYKISDYSKQQAKKLNVKIQPSTSKNKKIDVYKTERNVKIVSIGQKGYSDYPTYLKTDGKKVADQKRKLYKARHNCEDKISKQVAGYYACKILW